MTSSSQTKTDEPDGGRPATQARRVHGRLPACQADSAEERGTQIVERRERVQELPDRPDHSRDDRHANPAVDPQEECRDAAVARPAGDPLGHDPGPADQADEAKPIPDWRPRHGAGSMRCRRGRPDVADDHEDERERNGRRGTHEVDGQRQPALVRRVQGVGRDRRREHERQPERTGDAGGETTAPVADHAGRLRRTR